MEETTERCACPNCQCGVDSEESVEREGLKFCSSNCASGHADGPGCCDGCSCG